MKTINEQSESLLHVTVSKDVLGEQSFRKPQVDKSYLTGMYGELLLLIVRDWLNNVSF